jgi:hypothetical protein
MVVDLAFLPTAAVVEIDRAANADMEKRVDMAEKHLLFFRATICAADPIAIQGADAHGLLDGRHVDPDLAGQLRETLQRLADNAMLKSGAFSSSALGVVRIHSLHVSSGPE